MDTEGPVSVLDRRTRSTSRDRIIADRITRQRSPGPAFRHGGCKAVCQAGSDYDDQQEVIYRIPQPYRTSFSAKHSVTWGKADRSRSLSPTSSLRSELSCSSVPPMVSARADSSHSRGRSKNQKHVTYDTRVTVRHSDTEDSVVTELSSYEDEEIPLRPNISPFSRSIISPRYIEFSQLPSHPATQISSPDYPEVQRQVIDVTNLCCHSSLSEQSALSEHSPLDYSDELRNLTEQIARMDWSPKQTRKDKNLSKQMASTENYFQNYKSASPTEILTDSQNSHGSNRGLWLEAKKSSSEVFLEGQDFLIRETDHVQQKGDVCSLSLLDTSHGYDSPGGRSLMESGRLTPSKRSISLSITNLLKRVSPHFRKKHCNEPGRKYNSAQSSAQSLASMSDTETDFSISTSEDKNSGQLSRSRVRQSLLKFVGRSGSRSKKQNKPHHQNGHYSGEVSDSNKQVYDVVDDVMNGCISKTDKDIRKPDVISTIGLKSAEMSTEHHSYISAQNQHQSSGSQQDMDVTDSTDLVHITQGTVTSDTVTGRMDFFTEFDINAILHPSLDKSNVRMTNFEDNGKCDVPEVSLSQPTPPTSLDIMPPRTKRLLQTSVMSSISGDESIGDCSLDANLTASEPSLLSGVSQSGASRQVVIPQSLVSSAEGQLVSGSDNTNVRRILAEREDQLSPQTHLPQGTSSRLDPPSPADSQTYKPSYLKLSCAVSGYSRYSQYSTMKDSDKRSPSSSQSSLSLPDSSMPAEQLSGADYSSQVQTKHNSVILDNYSDSIANVVSGDTPIFPTGDVKKEGEYFLQLKLLEEDRLKGLCSLVEADLRSHDIPKEVSGKMQTAISQANLLISQEFVQFTHLCHKHMQKSPGERETKWEELQGFWDFVKVQIDSVDDMFSELQMMKQTC